jgi:uncharacterized protein
VTDSVSHLTGFGRALRSEGIGVGTGAIAEFCRAAALLAPGDLYWAGRATLVSRREDVPVYDEVFGRYFGADEDVVPRPRPRPIVRRSAGAVARTPPPAASESEAPEAALASTVETLKRKRFSQCTPEELAQLADAVARVRLAVPRRRTRRTRRAAAGAPDLRRTLRRSFRTGGEPVDRAWRERRRRPRRLVLVLDVSGSMADYSRALLVFAHAALRGDRRWEAFCFGTRLTRVTTALGAARPDDALARAAETVVDWDGGTRIGESLKTFLDDFGHGGVARGAVVVICSDGLDVGEPELLAEQMARLSRLAHAVVWLNPLKEDPAYEPLARGMRSALPYVDVFASAHDVASLEALGTELARL